ncbi:head GIN domain-containing protein [Flavisolibacter tropicus]|uniref:Putative auto-transporter adhesin head GIN domain-containing protein n=1 Tax=Flavisolibacter tropicus TaxID=1492898 RepID=A0A172TYR1_9BACT|nr:head GIN domain-containing protein [Flavisolibacter tropicus]ANE51923.1 hypothetical protein SY85_16920 [Flavisolibacter tropicus]
MRKNVWAVAVAAVVSTTGWAQKNNQETLEGNGKLVTREVPVTSFSELKANGVYELKLSQGNKESVKIEADENLQDLFQVKNEGNRLVIDMKKMENKNLKSKNKMRVYVTFKNLRKMDLQMVGNVANDERLTFDNLALNNQSVGNVALNLKANKLDLDNHSVGNLTLSGEAQNAVLVHKSVGNLQASDFVVQTMNIDNSGIGSAQVNATKELKVKDNMMGKVKNKGAATVRRMNKEVI